MSKKPEIKYEPEMVESVEIKNKILTLKVKDNEETIDFDYDKNIDDVIQGLYIDLDYFDFRKLTLKIDLNDEIDYVIGAFININLALSIEINKVDEELYQIFYKMPSGARYSGFTTINELESLRFNSIRIRNLLEEKGL